MFLGEALSNHIFPVSFLLLVIFLIVFFTNKKERNKVSTAISLVLILCTGIFGWFVDRGLDFTFGNPFSSSLNNTQTENEQTENVETGSVQTENTQVENTQIENTDSFVSNKLVHSHDIYESKKENIVAATCSTFGYYDSVDYCRCGKELGRETITTAVLTHNYITSVTVPTCTEQGFTTYSCLLCEDCYTTEYTNPFGHYFDKGFCIRCQQKDPERMLLEALLGSEGVGSSSGEMPSSSLTEGFGVSSGKIPPSSLTEGFFDHSSNEWTSGTTSYIGDPNPLPIEMIESIDSSSADSPLAF